MRAAGAQRLRFLTAAQRLSALACLFATYQCAVTWFDPRWLAASLATAVFLAIGPLYWAERSNVPEPPPRPTRAQLWRNLVPGWVLMPLGAACQAASLPPRLAGWAWLAGAAWLLAGAWALSPRSASSVERGSRRWAWGCGLAIVALAAALRLWHIGTVPRYVHCDEGTVNLIAQEFYRDPTRYWFAPPPKAGAYAMMNLNFALAGMGTLLFGFNLAGARASDVLLGILSVALLFDGVRRVSNLRLATVSAVLLAVNHCHLAYSRIASGYIQTAFVVSLAFAIWSRVWTTPTVFNAVLLGVVMALGVQTYAASSMSLPLLVAAMGLVFLWHRKRRRALLLPLGLFALSCAAAGAPFGVAVWQHGDEMTGRSEAINIFSEPVMEGLKNSVYHTDSAAEVVLHQAWNAVRGFHVGGDHQPQYGIHQPMADRYTAALMIPGAVFAVIALRQFLAANALVFTLGYLLLGLGMEYAPGFNRTTGALPLGMVIAAIALVQCVDVLWGARRRWSRWAANLSLAAVVALCAATNLRIYFVDYGSALLVGDGPSEAGWVAREYAGQYTVHLVDWPLPGEEGLRLILGDLPVQLHEDKDTVHYARTAEVTGSDLFILYGEDKAALAALLARFPDARVETRRRHPIHGPTLILVFVGSPRTTASAAG